MKQKIIEIDGNEILFKASAALPIVYKNTSGRDIYKDTQKLMTSLGTEDEMDMQAIGIINDLAYAMARHGGERKDNEEWLEQFGMFSLVGIAHEIIELWGMNNLKEVTSKKNPVAPKGK